LAEARDALEEARPLWLIRQRYGNRIVEIGRDDWIRTRWREANGLVPRERNGHAGQKAERSDVKFLDARNRSRALLWATTLEWRRDDEGRASSPDGVAIQGLTAGMPALAQRSADVPPFRHFTAGVLPLETALRGTRGGGAG
jgi:hypothetical protein